MSLTANSHPIVSRGCRVSRAPPHHTLRGGLPAFINLHGRKCTFGKPDKLLWDKLRDLRYLHLFITSPGISSRLFFDRSTCCKFNKLPINSSISSIFTSDIDKSLRSSKLPMIGNIKELVYNYF